MRSTRARSSSAAGFLLPAPPHAARPVSHSLLSIDHPRPPSMHAARLVSTHRPCRERRRSPDAPTPWPRAAARPQRCATTALLLRLSMRRSPLYCVRGVAMVCGTPSLLPNDGGTAPLAGTRPRGSFAGSSLTCVGLNVHRRLWRKGGRRCWSTFQKSALAALYCLCLTLTI